MGEDFAATAEGTLIFQIRLHLDPFMIHETFLYLSYPLAELCSALEPSGRSKSTPPRA
jgi:hypothetical protein